MSLHNMKLSTRGPSMALLFFSDRSTTQYANLKCYNVISIGYSHSKRPCSREASASAFTMLNAQPCQPRSLSSAANWFQLYMPHTANCRDINFFINFYKSCP